MTYANNDLPCGIISSHHLKFIKKYTTFQTLETPNMTRGRLSC
jgi:hypothetical protein